MKFELCTVFNLTNEIRREEYRLANLRDALDRITAPVDGQPRRSDYRSRIDELTAEIVDCENRLRDLHDEKLVAQLNMLTVIRRAGLEPTEERVAELRYASCLPFDEIPAKVNYSKAHVFKIHRRAKEKLLAQFDEIVATFEE